MVVVDGAQLSTMGAFFFSLSQPQLRRIMSKLRDRDSARQRWWRRNGMEISWVDKNGVGGWPVLTWRGVSQ